MISDELSAKRLMLSSFTLKAVIVHTVTYFLAGFLAYTLGGYEKTFSEPPLSYFMRPTSGRWLWPAPCSNLCAGSSLRWPSTSSVVSVFGCLVSLGQ